MVIQSSMSRVVNSTKSGFQHYALKSPLSDHCAAHHPVPQTAESEDRMTVDDALKVATMRDVELWKMCRERTNVAGHLQYLDSPDSLRAEALDVLAGELARLRGMRCETCQHQHVRYDECGLLEKGGYDDAYVRSRREYHDCDTLGRTCGAWEAK
jgi:hypothetical protein